MSWDPGDAAALRQFMRTTPDFLKTLEEKMPKIETTTTEGAAMSGARHAGAEDILGAIREMATDIPLDPSSPYVAVERD